MKLTCVAAATIGLVLLAGCSSSGSSSPSASGPSGSASVSSPSANQQLPSLAGKVLGISDLPTGWSLDHSKSGGGTTGCVSPAAVSKQAAEHKDVSFAYNGSLPTLAESIGYFPTNVANDFQTGIKTLDACHQFKTSNGTKVHLGRSSFPRVGDNSAAFTGTASIKGINVTLNFVAFQKGNYIALIVYADLGSTDLAAVQKFVTKAASLIG